MDISVDQTGGFVTLTTMDAERTVQTLSSGGIQMTAKLLGLHYSKLLIRTKVAYKLGLQGDFFSAFSLIIDGILIQLT